LGNPGLKCIINLEKLWKANVGIVVFCEFRLKRKCGNIRRNFL
jgi:hypothetical protein